MNFDLTEDQQLLADTLRRWTSEQVRPHSAAWQGDLPASLGAQLAELGLFGVALPSHLGGAGLDGGAWAVAVETLAMAHGGVATLAAVRHAVVAGFGELAAVAQARQEILTGACCAGWGPRGGPVMAADPGGLAVITDGQQAWALSIAADQWTPWGDALGLEGIGWGTLGQANVEQGASIAAEPGLSWLRVGLGAVCVGLGQEALNRAATYAKERQQFNQPIASFQAIQFKLADAATQLQSARWLLYRAAAELTTAPDASRAAMAYQQAGRAAELAADHAIQIHGGNGYVREYEVERIYRDVQVCRASLGGARAAQQVIAHRLLAD